MTLDFDARYAVDSYPGVAFYLRGYLEEFREVEWTSTDCADCGEPITLQPSGWWTHDGLPGACWRQSMDGGETLYHYDVEPYTNESMVRAVMVGDDREHILDVDELTAIDVNDYCAGCGQIGCPHG